jgi:hypothetical protein
MFLTHFIIPYSPLAGKPRNNNLSLRAAPDFCNRGFQLCFLDPGFFALRTGLTQKLLEFLELGWRDQLKDYSVSLANNELVAFVESEIVADLFGDNELSSR